MVLPEMLRGVCIAELPEASMPQATAFAAALCGALLMRSALDVVQPMPVGDTREGGRLMLQWCLVVGLTPLLWFAINGLTDAGFAPSSSRLGPWLRGCIGLYGALLAGRALLRAQATLYTREAALTPSIPEVDRRAPVEEVDALPPMLTLERAEPEPRMISGSNIPGFAVGALLLAIALVGWNMNSLCLFRLPR